jgi:hypothetical protein
VWTAGHCLHAGGSGGWYRNLVFVPVSNDLAKSEAALTSANPSEIAPYGNWGADWASTLSEWLQGGFGDGRRGCRVRLREHEQDVRRAVTRTR